MSFDNYIKGLIGRRSVAILGYGREGRSTSLFLRRLFPEKVLAIADSAEISLNIAADAPERSKLRIISGDDYLEQAFRYDIVFKSPGVPVPDELAVKYQGKLTSQADAFLRYFADKTVGITGTKGKSTTTSLVHNILVKSGRRALLAGNIGIPVFDIADKMGGDAIAVCELSSHQLEFIERGPALSVLLNVFEDHLDHFITRKNYFRAKENIILHQADMDTVIINRDQDSLPAIIESRGLQRNVWQISIYPHGVTGAWAQGDIIHCRFPSGELFRFDFGHRTALHGRHNLYNIMAACCTALVLGTDPAVIEACVNSFQGLPHRMEFVGTYHGILFYNDAIATIPEATIGAVEALGNVDTLIIGGKDRGIDYSALVKFLDTAELNNLILTGESGRRIRSLLHSRWGKEKRCFLLERFTDFIGPALSFTVPGKICLLSPASASYDEFVNFEEKGKVYKQIVSNTGGIADNGGSP